MIKPIKNLKFAAVLLLVNIATLPQAHAVHVNFGAERGWSFNDLINEPQVRSLLGGASATVVNRQDTLSTIIIHKSQLSNRVNPQGNASAWSKIVTAKALGLGRGDHLSYQKAFRVAGEWRYYVELRSDGTVNAPSRSSIMAVLKGNTLVMFSFQQDPQLFKKRIAKIKKLYQSIKVDKI